MGWHCKSCGSGGTGSPRDCCGDAAVIAAGRATQQGLMKRNGFEMFASAGQNAAQGALRSNQDGAADMARAAYGMESAQNFVQVRTVTVEKVVPPTVETLARALFQTDDEVIRFLSDVGDAVAPVMPPNTDWGQVGVLVMAKAERAEQIAWDRDEGGWRTRARHRAERVLIHIEDSATPTGSVAGDKP